MTTRAPAMSSGLWSVARIITTLATVVAAIIAAGIVLKVLGASSSNDIVNVVVDAASWLSAPFHGLFNLSDNDWQVVLNWGLAAVVYLVVARLVARMLLR